MSKRGQEQIRAFAETDTPEAALRELREAMTGLSVFEGLVAWSSRLVAAVERVDALLERLSR